MTRYPSGTVTFLFTDVVGSSRLWEEHYEAMHRAMAGHDAIVKQAVAAAGVFIKQTGDGAFAVFSSAFDAIEAATTIQRDLAALPGESPPGFAVRIGVHTGEAELRDGDYFGSTVNRAARVMSTAGGGEVLLSAATQEVVRDRLPAGLALQDAGERELRGMSRPEHVFVLSASDEYAAQLDRSPPTPKIEVADEEARRAAWIAVLPFENMSGDLEQDYFAEGISEDVITRLSAFRSLRVIARTSSFRYKGSQASISRIAADLGVRFVLEGSVRKAGDRVRVTAQLVEAPARHHVWADRYDARLDDIFDVQDEITSSIVVAVHPAIRVVESERVRKARPESMDAWDHVQRGWSEFFTHKKHANKAAVAHFEAAVGLDPEYAEAHAGLSSAHAFAAWLLWADDPHAALDLAYAEARRAVALDPRDAMSHTTLAVATYAMGRLDASAQAAERAIEFNPSLPTAHLFGGVAKIHGGRPEEGIRMIDRALVLNPRDPGAHWFHGGRAIGNFLIGDHESAVADARRGISLRYGYLFGRVVLTASLAEMGRIDEAREEMAVILSIQPDFSPAFLDLYTFSNEADRRRLVDGLRAAGLET